VEPPPTFKPEPVFEEPKNDTMVSIETNVTENLNDDNLTEENIIEVNQTENQTIEEPEPELEPEPEPAPKPRRGNTLNRIEVLVGGQSCSTCIYLIEDSWKAIDGVIVADLRQSDKEGEVIYAPWLTDEDEIVEAIKPRFSAKILSRSTCTYDLGFSTYCCSGDCYYLRGLKDELN
jgi:hypothetical protein